MKQIKKKHAKLYIVLIAIVLAVASVFCFIPMKWGNFTTYHSFLGDIHFAGDIQGNYYAEYKITKGNTDSKIAEAGRQIQSVLSSKGYSNANIFNIGGETLRIQISSPNGGQSDADTITLLRTIGVGAFELRSSSSDDAEVLDGATYVKDVSIKNYNGQIMAYIEFNEAGKTRFMEVVSATTSNLYVYMGGQSQTSFDVDGITSFDALPLTFTDYESAEDFKTKVKLGSLPITLDSNIVEINTMSSSLGNGSTTANPNTAMFNCSLTKLLSLITLAVIIVLGLAYMIVRFKVLGLINLVAFLAEAIIMIFMLWAIPTIELSITGVLALIFGTLLIFASTLAYFKKIEDERKLGKTITASIESATKKMLPVSLVSALVVAVASAVVTIFTTGAIQIAGFIMMFSSLIALVATIGILPLFVNIFEAFNKGNEKPYGKTAGGNA